MNSTAITKPDRICVPHHISQAKELFINARHRDRSIRLMDLLRVQPYQHILETGFGNGSLMEEVARKLQVGFIAGNEPNPDLFRLAWQRNKKFVHRQLMQLHAGELEELPYPPYYFHSVYGSNVYRTWQKPVNALMHLHRLLKQDGKLVLIFQEHRNAGEQQLKQHAKKHEEELFTAGFVSAEFFFQPTSKGTEVMVVGRK